MTSLQHAFLRVRNFLYSELLSFSLENLYFPSPPNSLFCYCQGWGPFLTWTGHHFFVLNISPFTIDQGVQRETRNKDSDIHESESGHSSTSLLVMFFNCMYARLLSRSQGFQMHMGNYTWLVSRLWDTQTNEDSFSEVLEMENLN